MTKRKKSGGKPKNRQYKVGPFHQPCYILYKVHGPFLVTLRYRTLRGLAALSRDELRDPELSILRLPPGRECTIKLKFFVSGACSLELLQSADKGVKQAIAAQRSNVAARAAGGEGGGVEDAFDEPLPPDPFLEEMEEPPPEDPPEEEEVPVDICLGNCPPFEIMCPPGSTPACVDGELICEET